MSGDFWKEFEQRRPAIEAALLGDDFSQLTQLVNELAEHLAAIDERLNVNIGGPDPFHLAILHQPGAEAAAVALVTGRRAPANWDVTIGTPTADPLEAIHVEDDSGETLTLRYADLEAKVLPPRGGTVTIVLSLDADFDPSGPRQHLYQAAAQNVINTILGGHPPQLSYAVLLPRSQSGRLLPLDSLRQQWLAAMETIDHS